MSGTLMLNGTNYTATGNLILGGGASVVQKTMAEYTALPTADKMNGSIYKITDKALIYCLDEEYHAVKEITSADYALLSSAEKNNGTLYILTDEETTAADISYTSGVSVADMLDITDITSSYCTLSTGYSLDAGSRVYKQGKHIWGNLLIVASTALPGANDSVTIGSINSSYRTEEAVNGFCGLSNGQWFTNDIGYLYIAVNGSVVVAAPSTGKTYIKMMIDYCTA